MNIRRLSALGILVVAFASSILAGPRSTEDAETALLAIRNETGTELRVGPPGRALRVPLVVLGAPMTLDLQPQSHRGKDFRVEVLGDDGAKTLIDPGLVRTLAGSVLEIPGSVVTGTRFDDGLEAFIQLPDGQGLWLEPAARKHAGADSNAYVMAPCGSEDGGAVCALESTASRDRTLIAASNGDGCAQLGGCVAKLACDTDFAFYQAYAGNASQVQAAVESLVAYTNSAYAPFKIRHEIASITVRASPAADPYDDTDVVDHSTILNKMRATWPSGPQDLVHLFTGRHFSGYGGAALGVAGICSFNQGQSMHSYSSGAGSDCARAGVVAHELGHSWGANHTSTGIMRAGAYCNAGWHQASVSAISSERDLIDALCLDLERKDAEVLRISVPSTMVAGSANPVSVTLRNNGTLSWSPVGPQNYAYRFGAWNETGWGVQRAEFAAAVPAGQTVTLSFTVIAPPNAGNYTFQWRMVHEGVEWFGAPTPSVPVTVTSLSTVP